MNPPGGNAMAEMQPPPPPHPTSTRQASSAPGRLPEPARGRPTAPGRWGSLFEHLLTAEESGERSRSPWSPSLPGIATPLHRHSREAEAFFLLEGHHDLPSGRRDLPPGRGRLHLAPRRCPPHAFRITGDRPVRFLGLADPRATSSGSTTRWACPPANAVSPARTAGPWQKRSRAGMPSGPGTGSGRRATAARGRLAAGASAQPRVRLTRDSRARTARPASSG